MNNFEYRVYEEVLNDMINGTKKVEIRLYNEKSSKIKINDINLNIIILLFPLHKIR